MTNTDTTANDRVSDDYVFTTDTNGDTTVPDGYGVIDIIDELLTTDGNVTKLDCPCGGPAAVVVDGRVYTAPESHIPDFLVLNLLIERGVIDENDVSDEVKAKVAIQYVEDLAMRVQAQRATFGGASFGDTFGAMLGGDPRGNGGSFGFPTASSGDTDEDNYVPGTYL